LNQPLLVNKSKVFPIEAGYTSYHEVILANRDIVKRVKGTQLDKEQTEFMEPQHPLL
jgi:hypothetical protein